MSKSASDKVKKSHVKTGYKTTDPRGCCDVLSGLGDFETWFHWQAARHGMDRVYANNALMVPKVIW